MVTMTSVISANRDIHVHAHVHVHIAMSVALIGSNLPCSSAAESWRSSLPPPSAASSGLRSSLDI